MTTLPQQPRVSCDCPPCQTENNRKPRLRTTRKTSTHCLNAAKNTGGGVAPTVTSRHPNRAHNTVAKANPRTTPGISLQTSPDFLVLFSSPGNGASAQWSALVDIFNDNATKIYIRFGIVLALVALTFIAPKFTAVPLVNIGKQPISLFPHVLGIAACVLI